MQSVGSGRRGVRGLGALAALAIVVLALAACGGGGSGSGQNSTTSAANAQKGGTAYWAEAPQATPNYIFPFAAFAYFSVANLTQFQELLYRPLYWFGNGATPNLNPALSIAKNPTYSHGNTVVTVTFKPYQWSNGETVTPQDAVFWLNMMKVEKTIWAGYVPGTIPDDIKSISTSGNKLTITLTGKNNPNWYTYNELSQITPMPMAWDLSAKGQKAGSQACGTATFQSVTVKSTTSSQGTSITPVSAAAKSCAAVYKYLDAQAKKISSYVSSPIWSVVDGPWKLQHMDTSGNVTFVPNKKYSGTVKPHLSKFVELPYTSDSAEFNALAAKKVDVGYLPTQDITASAVAGSGPCDLKPGANNPRLSGYDIDPVFPWGINYFPLNLKSTANNGQAGKIFSQLYFRQAFQLLVNQPLYIKQINKGYGVPTYGPVPVCPKNNFATSKETSNPYTYDKAKAIGLLKSHGWNVKPGGTTTCSDAAKCGVPAGTPLNINLQYASGTASIDQLMQAEKSSWAQAGIKVNLTTATFNTVIGVAVPCSGSSCTWEMENWGGGWIYAPDYYPSGEDLFQTGASSNAGTYSNKKADTLIKQTTQGNANLANYENYLAVQLPVVWQPNPVTAFEVNKKLLGVAPINPLQTLNPEAWYFTK
jgi:peptide/nickel transport system substrate-binding protein